MASSRLKILHGAALRSFLLGLLVIVALFWLSARYSHAIEMAELKVSDLRMYARPGRKPLGVVAIAAVDDQSIAQLGRWPWPRSTMARLVDALRDYQVKVIGFDIFFSERDNADVQREQIAERLRTIGLSAGTIASTLGVSNDLSFAHAIQEQGSTILGYPLASHQFRNLDSAQANKDYVTTIQTPPPLAYGTVLKAAGPAPALLLIAHAYLPPIPPLLKAARGSAFVDIDADGDGVMRSEMTVVRFHNRYCVPLFLGIAAAYRDGAPLLLRLSPAGVSNVAIGDEQIPVDEMGRMMVDFRGGETAFPRYSIADIINHRIPQSALAKKIVLIGVTGHGLGDRVVTPVGADYPAVEIHANAIDDLLQGTFIRRSETSEGEAQLAAILLGIAITAAAATLSALWSFLALVILAGGYFLYAQVLLTFDGTLVDVVFPLGVAATTYALLASFRYATEGREKRRIRHAFEHYLHPGVISSVVDDPQGLRLGGERRHLSILFSDIVNFTARAERSEPEALVALLNTYTNKMSGLIFDSRGVLDKLMGDGIMAFWGAPLPIENASRAAIDCALGMLEELGRLRASDERFADLDIGIGVATGDVIVGNFGGDQHFEYSVIGDTVNLASRLEGLTRRFGSHLIVTLKTLNEAGGANRYLVREIGLVKVKGKEELVAVVEVVGRAGDSGDPGYVERYAEALGSLKQGAAEAARQAFNALLSEKPDDRLIALYLEKLAAGELHMPGEVVFEFETK
ncbi:MAG TPA: adenylate/guanylate cyclase domain-containing protein [Candidatus Binataceae bacterium]|nr:adenylate/guanylate cyclase domain-containing protein [Candidatus Binataceae bacterium]